MENFVIHIFGYGETQLITPKFNFKTKTETLKKVKAVVDGVFGLKPSDSQATSDVYRVVNIFGKGEAMWGSKEGFKVSDISSISTKVDALVKELTDAYEAQLPPKP